MNFIDSTLNPALTLLPQFFFGAVLLLAVVFYYLTVHRPENPRPRFKKLAFWAIGFKFFYAAILTVGQYFLWSEDQFAKLFLNQPLKHGGDISAIGGLPLFSGTKLGYFLFYSWGHFWLNAFLSLAIALAFWLFLKALEKKESRFFYPGETELGFALTLAVGWPGFVVFLPLAFIAVVLVSLFRLLFMKEAYTTIGWPFILAAIAAFAFGQIILGNLNWEFLKISLSVFPALA
jgi:hypothetical protein